MLICCMKKTISMRNVIAQKEKTLHASNLFTNIFLQFKDGEPLLNKTTVNDFHTEQMFIADGTPQVINCNKAQ